MNKQRAAYTRSRTIRVKGDKIYYYLKNDNQLDVITFNEELYKILTDKRLSPFRDADGRLRFTLCCDGGVRYKYRIHDLAFGCYHGLVRYDTLIEDMQKYFNGKIGLTIDHLDSNCHNNTKNNLSLIESELNKAKSSITYRVKLPNKIVCAFVDGRYRIEFVNAATDSLESMINALLADRGIRISIERTGREATAEHYICNTADDFVDCLKWCVSRSAEWAETIKPQRGGYINNQNKCYSDDLETAITVQERVAALPIEAFQIWKTKQ